MEVLCLILLGLLSIWLAYQDFSSRTVDLIGIVLFLAGAILYHFFVRPVDLIAVALNIGFLATLALVSVIVVKVVFNKTIKSMIGMGDVLYLIVAALFFELPTFIIWFNASLLIALFSHLVLTKILSRKGEKARLVPLLGYFSIVFCITLFYESYGGSLGTVIS
jgi:hypothetical protein